MTDAFDIILAAIFDAADMARRCSAHLSECHEAQFCEDQLYGIQATINAMQHADWITISESCELAALIWECRDMAAAASWHNATRRLAA